MALRPWDSLRAWGGGGGGTIGHGRKIYQVLLGGGNQIGGIFLHGFASGGTGRGAVGSGLSSSTGLRIPRTGGPLYKNNNTGRFAAGPHIILRILSYFYR